MLKNKAVILDVNHCKLKTRLSIGFGFAVLTLLCGQLLAQENASQLFLAPDAVPETVYTPIDMATTGSTTFTASQVAGGTVIYDVAVLPELDPNPSSSDGSYTPAQLAAINSSDYGTYFAETPTVNYSASSPGGANDTVTFNQTGMYFVQLTTDAGTGIFQVNVNTDILGGTATGPARQTVSPPNNGTTIVSDAGGTALNNVTALLPNAQTASGIAQIETEVANEYAALGDTKFELTLIGHGTPGTITIGSDTISIANAASFQEALDPYLSSIHFVSCNTGAGTAGVNFLVALQQSIPVATAWNDFVAAPAGGPLSVSAEAQLQVCPEPGSLGLLALGCTFFGLRLRRQIRA